MLESGGGDNEKLERQLQRLTADHEQLLNSREELRREQQALQTRVDDVQGANAALQTQNAELQSQLDAGEARQKEIGRQVEALLEERDNLLAIRDQLTSKVNASLDGEQGIESRKELEGDIAELQASVKRLTDQREQLALELSDARNELATARESLPADDSACRR